MRKEDIYIPGADYDGSQQLQHSKWSEEAKERVRQARRAGRSVSDMFANFYKTASRQVNRTANTVANATIYKNRIQKGITGYRKAKANAAVRNAKAKVTTRAGNTNAWARAQQTNRRELDSARKTMSRNAKNKSTGRIAKDFVDAGVKELRKGVRGASKATNKALKNAGKVASKTAKDLDKAVTKSVNKYIENKDRATQTKGERARIARKVAGAKSQYTEVARRSADLDYKKNASGIDRMFGTKKVKKARAKADEKARKTVDKKVAKVMRDAREAEVTKNKYKSVGDMISKNLNKAKKSVSKTLNDINTNGGKGYDLVGRTRRHESSSSDRGVKYEEGVRAASITDALTGKTNDYRRYSTYRTEKAKKTTKKLKQTGLSQNDVYIPGRIGTSDEYLRNRRL